METDFRGSASINELFEFQAAQRPEAVALEHEATRWTYRELNQRSNKIAQTLRQAGTQIESLVGICMERSADLIAGMLAILKAGGAYVPIDPSYSPEKRAQMLEGVPILLTTKSLVGEFETSSARVLCLDDENLAKASGENLPSSTRNHNLAYVIYHPGSTGQPTGVAVMHEELIRLLGDANFLTIEESDALAQTLNVCFDASVLEIWGALLNGARLVIFDQETVLSPPRLKQELERCGITVMAAANSQFNMMVREAPEALAKMKYLLFGGEEGNLLEALSEQLSSERVCQPAAEGEASKVASKPEGVTSESNGKPIPKTSIYLLDADRNSVPVGAVGEICIGGAGMSRANLGPSKLIPERLMSHPFEPGAFLYRTGDLARWLADGTIDLIGGIDARIKIAGFRVEPKKVENLPESAAPQDAVVVMQQDELVNEHLVAYRARDTSQLLVAELGDYLKTVSPDQIPSSATSLKPPGKAKSKLIGFAVKGALWLLSVLIASILLVWATKPNHESYKALAQAAFQKAWGKNSITLYGPIELTARWGNQQYWHQMEVRDVNLRWLDYSKMVEEEFKGEIFPYPTPKLGMGAGIGPTPNANVAPLAPLESRVPGYFKGQVKVRGQVNKTEGQR